MKLPLAEFTLLQIHAHGRGQRRYWRKNDLQFRGSYSTREEAEEEKDKLVKVFGHGTYGDIIVNDEEYDLLILDKNFD